MGKLISSHLMNCKFIKIQKNGKAPAVDKNVDWNTQKVYFAEAHEFLKEGYNVGLVADENILIVDADKPESIEWCDKNLPLTLTELTCSGGKHYFYTPLGEIKNTLIGKDKGEVRCNRQYVVIAPSIAPSKNNENKGELKEYTIIRDISVATITQQDVDRLVSFFTNINLNVKSNELIQKEVDGKFVVENIFSEISPFVKDLIVKKKTKEELSDLGFPSRSERDAKIISHLLMKGFGEYIKSIFNIYPCGDKFREHTSPDKYLTKTIEETIKYLGIRTKGDMDLEFMIEDSSVMWLKRHLDEVLLKISAVIDNTNLFKDSLLITLAFRIKMSQLKLEKRLKELVDESKPREIISMFDLSLSDVEPQEYWVDPLLPKGAIVILGAKPGVGKSLFIQALTTSILSLGSFLGYKCEGQPKILLYSVDDSSKKMLHQRNSSLINGLKKNPDFNISKLKNLNTSFVFNKHNLRKEIDVALGYDIILLDSYRRVLKGEENNSETTDTFFNEFLKPLKEAGKTIIILHHLRKANLEEIDDSELQDTLRGSGDVVSQVDLAFILTSLPINDQPPLVDVKDCTLKVVKNRLGIPFRDMNNNLNNSICYRVTRHLQTDTTVFEYLNPALLKSPKERRKDCIKKVLSVSSGPLTRDQLITQVTRLIGCSDIAVEKDIDVMWKSGEIVKEKFGSYSMNKQVKENDSVDEEK